MGNCYLKWEILVVPLGDFPLNLVSVMNPPVTVMLDVWSVLPRLCEKIYLRDGMSLLPIARGLCLEPILWIFLPKGALGMTKVLENLSDLP